MNKGIATIDPSYADLLKTLHGRGVPFIVTSFGSPYLPNYDYVDTYIAAYGYGSVLVEAAANALLTNIDITGRLPVDLDKKLIRGSQNLVYRDDSKLENIDVSYSLSVIDSAIEAKIFPGAQVFISQHGETLVSKGFGYHTYHKSKEVSTETIFDLASITKVVSATPIVMKLVENEELSLEQPINDFFPGFYKFGKDTIKIRHLLIHESGLSAYHRYFLESKYKGRGDILDNIINRRLTYKPGTEYKYSDLGMILLGTILERIGGNNLHALGKSWFFTPLGMNNTFYNPPANQWKNIPPTERTVIPIGTSNDSFRRKIANISTRLFGPMKSLSYDIFPRKTAHGYVHDENANLLGGVSAHAGLFSNAEDLGKYGQMLLNDGMVGDKKIIDKDLLSLFTKRQSTVDEANRGYGWDRPDRDGSSSAGDYFSDKTFGHLGYTGTSFWIDPEQELVVVLLTNRVYPTRKNLGIKQVRRKFHNTLIKSILRLN
jgi:CubicO group peptidase (beta-lactamase class C family)